MKKIIVLYSSFKLTQKHHEWNEKKKQTIELLKGSIRENVYDSYSKDFWIQYENHKPWNKELIN